jgi:hypothetical protein
MNRRRDITVLAIIATSGRIRLEAECGCGKLNVTGTRVSVKKWESSNG